MTNRKQSLDVDFNFCDRADIETSVAKWAKWLKSGLLCMVVLSADDYNSAFTLAGIAEER